MDSLLKFLDYCHSLISLKERQLGIKWQYVSFGCTCQDSEHPSSTSCSDCQIYRKNSMWHLSGLELANCLSKRFPKPWWACVSFTWVMLSNSGSSHWDLSEQCCRCVFTWPRVLLHLGFLAGLRLYSSPWASLEITVLQWKTILSGWPFVTILRLTLLSFCGYHEPTPVRVLSFQACCHTRMPGHLLLLSNPLLLLLSDSCQYIF